MRSIDLGSSASGKEKSLNGPQIPCCSSSSNLWLSIVSASDGYLDYDWLFEWQAIRHLERPASERIDRPTVCIRAHRENIKGSVSPVVATDDPWRKRRSILRTAHSELAKCCLPFVDTPEWSSINRLLLLEKASDFFMFPRRSVDNWAHHVRNRTKRLD